MRYARLAAILLALTCLGGPTFADPLTLKCSFVGPIPQDITYNVNGDSNEVEVIGEFGTHKGLMLSNTDGFFYVLEPSSGASFATMIYSKPGETPVGIRSMLGLLNEDQFKGMPDDVKLSSERLRFMAWSVKGRCRRRLRGHRLKDSPSQNSLKPAGGDLGQVTSRPLLPVSSTTTAGPSSSNAIRPRSLCHMSLKNHGRIGKKAHQLP